MTNLIFSGITSHGRFPSPFSALCKTSHLQNKNLSLCSSLVFLKGASPMNTLQKRKFQFSYHWIIFIISFMMVFFGMGFASSTRSSYKSAITGDEVAGLTNIFYYGFSETFRYVATAILNVFFGVLVAKFGARRLVGAGFASLTLSCLICSFATDYWHLYVGAIFLGIGFAWTTTTIVGLIVEKWFTNSKGTIMGMILGANGLGGMFSEIIINPMCNGEGNLGWRIAYLITAGIFFVVGFLAVIFIRNDPAEVGVAPLGQNTVAKKKRGADWVGYEMNDILQKPSFYICGICIFLTGMILQSMSGLSKIQIYSVVGKSNEMVAWVTTLYAVHSLVLMFSKVLAGFSFDKLGIRFTFFYCSLFAIIALLSLVFLSLENTWFAWIYGICSSIALPLESVMIPLLVSEVFGKKCHAKIMGYYLGFNFFGYACGGPLADYFKQNSDTYSDILVIFSIIMLITALAIQITFIVAKKNRNAFVAQLENK